MCKSILSQQLLSKPNLTEQLGGSQLDFLLLTFCEIIKEDSELRVLFSHMTFDQLYSTMRNLVMAAFKTDLFDAKARNGVVIRNYALFELGINSSDFQKIKAHFEHALRMSWVEEQLLKECSRCFGALQSIIEGEGAALRHTANAHRALATKFQAAPAAA